jgi:hypothetical protein
VESLMRKRRRSKIKDPLRSKIDKNDKTKRYATDRRRRVGLKQA